MAPCNVEVEIWMVLENGSDHLLDRPGEGEIVDSTE
ncbi:hypothetical protein M7I_2471 [Glarea lozoyensis 74030]|uniref:Uncharacterized protein n=1 Tax=Glarea lozoyensis (strain ATCC 74030 / MF5533) TaxID=1104152 RepID=H0EIV5_GLAL7|nr:hypothetical protein M7I_2471 [Glarea lozoyensis 74030]